MLTTGVVALFPVSSGPNVGWEIGYSRNFIDITFNDILSGGTQTFTKIALTDGSTTVDVGPMSVTNGQTVTINISTLLNDYLTLETGNFPSGGITSFSITNIVFRS